MLLVVAMMTGGKARAAVEPVDPGLCTVAPLTESDLTQYATASPVATPDLDTADLSETPVSDVLATEITTVVETSVSCANANEPLRALALFTPAYLGIRFGGNNQDDLGHLLAALSRTPAAAVVSERLSLVSVEDVVQLADGRIAATVVTENRDNRFTDTLILMSIDGSWKIDAVILGTPNPIGTPAP